MSKELEEFLGKEFNVTPDELMAKQGKYYRLVKIQSMADQVKLDKEKEHLE